MSAPNFLIIQADQMTPSALPVYGHPLTKMPHVSALAENGVVFENAYCNFPLCVPSRASTLTGRLANSIGVWDNAAEFPAATPTIAHYLRSVGYHTVLCGKMHFIGPDQVHGFNERHVTDIYPSTFAWTADWEAGERYRPTGINLRAVIESGVCVRSLQLDYDEEVAHASVQKIYDLVRYQEDQPFMMWVSFTQPHSPYLTTRKYWDLYEHQHIDMPAVAPIPVGDLDTMSRWLHYGHGGDLDTVSDEHVRTARHAYYGMCSYIDDKVGDLLAALDETGQRDNTVVIFLSDHGEMLGERGMWYKQYFYEPSARVPLVASLPGHIASDRRRELVSLIDLAPTLLDLATDGNPPEVPGPLEGRSLMTLMNGGAADWDDQVISEFTGEGVTAPCRMVRRGPHKYIYTHGEPPLLYDLDADPLELENIAGEPQLSDVEAGLKAAVLADWNPDEINAACLQSQKERLFIQKTTGGEPAWAYMHRVDDDRRYVRNASAVGTKAKARFPKYQA